MTLPWRVFRRSLGCGPGPGARHGAHHPHPRRSVRLALEKQVSP